MAEFKQVKLKGVPVPVEVNDDGTVVRCQDKIIKQHLVKTSKSGKGFLACSIMGKSFYVHRIVAEAFIVNKRPIACKFVMHLDNDLTNNRVTNLAWGNSKELYAKNRKILDAGEGKYRGSSTIPHDEAIKIAERLDKGEFAKDICLEYGVSEMSIARIRKRYCKEKNASPRYTSEIKATVYKLAAKYTGPEIAKITGLTYHTVYRWLKQKDKSDKKPNFYY